MNEPTICARSVSLPRRSLCQWVDTVTSEMLVKGGGSMKNMCEETSAAAGAGPKSQLEPRHDGGRWGGGSEEGRFGRAGIVEIR